MASGFLSLPNSDRKRGDAIPPYFSEYAFFFSFLFLCIFCYFIILLFNYSFIPTQPHLTLTLGHNRSPLLSHPPHAFIHRCKALPSLPLPSRGRQHPLPTLHCHPRPSSLCHNHPLSNVVHLQPSPSQPCHYGMPLEI